MNDSEQLADGAQIEIELVRRNVELLREVLNRFLKSHQRKPDPLRLIVGQRPSFHAADRLPFEQLTDQFDQREDQPQHGTANVVRVGIPAGRPRSGRGFNLPPDGVDLLRIRCNRRGRPSVSLPTGSSGLPPTSRSALHRLSRRAHRTSGANANGGNGPERRRAGISDASRRAIRS